MHTLTTHYNAKPTFMTQTQTYRRHIYTQIVAILLTFWTRPDLAGAMDALSGNNAMIYKHPVIPHQGKWRIHQNIINTKMERNTIDTKFYKLL